MSKRTTQKEAERLYRQNGFILMGEYKSRRIGSKCEDSNGFLHSKSLGNIIKTVNNNPNHTCKYIAYVENPYSIHNINRWLKINKGNYRCLNEQFISSNDMLDIIHDDCGTTFQASWNRLSQREKRSEDIYRHSARCPFCFPKYYESMHATALKDVWVHEYPDTIVEDKSYVHPITKRVRPTDIVNHSQKVAIEIQSRFHDNPETQIRDKEKKQFWTNKGYKFYAIDHRDYTILEAIQIFFPYIMKIPDYINFSFSNRINLFIVQDMINEGKSVSKIARIMGYESGTIYQALRTKKLYYSEKYPTCASTPVVQLDLDGSFIASHKSLAIAGAYNGISSSSIAYCLKKDYTNICCGYLWVEREDYENGNYIVPTPEVDKFMIPVDKYDRYGNLLCSFSTIREAANTITTPYYSTKIYKNAKEYDKDINSNMGIWRFPDTQNKKAS